MWCTWSFFIVYKNLFAKFFYIFICIICICIIYICTRFSLLGAWGSAPHQPKICSFPPSPASLYSLPTKSQFNPINKIKTSFLAVVIAAVATIFVLILYSLETEIMLILILIHVQYSQNAVFSFEKFSNRQNHSSSDSHHLVKKSPSSVHYFLTQSQGNS